MLIQGQSSIFTELLFLPCKRDGPMKLRRCRRNCHVNGMSLLFVETDIQIRAVHPVAQQKTLNVCMQSERDNKSDQQSGLTVCKVAQGKFPLS